MLDMNEIDREIAKLESSNTTYNTLEKLTVLYAVRDHQNVPKAIPLQSYAPTAMTSEFLEAASGVAVEDLLAVMDEHMDGVRVLYPKEYASVIRKITQHRL